MNTEKYIPTTVFHPGETLSEKIEEMGMTRDELSKQTEIPLSVIDDIMDGHYSISADMALAFEQVTAIPAKYWIKAQHCYDDYILQNKANTYKSRLNFFRRVAAVL